MAPKLGLFPSAVALTLTIGVMSSCSVSKMKPCYGYSGVNMVLFDGLLEPLACPILFAFSPFMYFLDDSFAKVCDDTVMGPLGLLCATVPGISAEGEWDFEKMNREREAAERAVQRRNELIAEEARREAEKEEQRRKEREEQERLAREEAERAKRVRLAEMRSAADALSRPIRR